MQKVIFTFILILTFGLNSRAQTMRYFEFKSNIGTVNWQDTTFIASATNQVLIDTVLANLARPMNQRKFIAGFIDYGNGGYNHNSTHWFLWHFIPDQWDLTYSSIELCDGRPYSDVDADTAYWVGTIGQFCPWSGLPVREVSNPLLINEKDLENEILIYPNPARYNLLLKWNSMNNISVTIFNSMGQALSTVMASKQNETIDITTLQNGIYFLKIIVGNKMEVKKLIVDGK